jgi:hypothetical protein
MAWSRRMHLVQRRDDATRAGESAVASAGQRLVLGEVLGLQAGGHGRIELKMRKR